MTRSSVGSFSRRWITERLDHRFEYLSPDRLANALETVRASDAAFIPLFLGPATVEALAREVSDARFDPQEPRYLKAEQRIESYLIEPPFAGYPLVGMVADRLSRAADAGDIGCGERFRPDAVSVHRYPAGDVGITPHRDEQKYRLLVASLTLEGAAEFSLVEDPERDGPLPPEDVLAARRSARIIDRWWTMAGDLTIMRAPGFDGHPDGRPLHTVSGGLRGPRLALVYRMSAG